LCLGLKEDLNHEKHEHELQRGAGRSRAPSLPVRAFRGRNTYEEAGSGLTAKFAKDAKAKAWATDIDRAP
jgi:hypothetical protein